MVVTLKVIELFYERFKRQMQFVWIVRLRFRLFSYAVVAEDRDLLTVKPRDDARKTGNEQEGKEKLFCHVQLSSNVRVRTSHLEKPAARASELQILKLVTVNQGSKGYYNSTRRTSAQKKKALHLANATP